MNSEQDRALTRRQALGAGVAVAAAGVAAASIGGLGSAGCAAQPGPEEKPAPAPTSGERMPVAFAPHGGGPWPFVDLGLDRAEIDDLTAYLRSLRTLPKTPPKALLVVSAHWEERVPTVMTSPNPPILYDYYGFPPASYQITWPAPGDPALAARVQALLGAAGFETATDASRGFDHGTFIPFKLTYPEADIPTVQLSLKACLDPTEHLAMCLALAPLRDEGFFLLGSGMTYHNMRGFRDPSAAAAAEEFDAWLRQTGTLEPAERDRRLADWARAPSARRAHPREEHLIPFMVIAGAAGADRGTVAYNGQMFGKRLSAYHFG